MARSLAFPLLVALAALVQGCSSADSADEAQAEQDPAVSGALSAPLMSDPDLAAINNGDAALGGGGPASAPIPVQVRNAEAIAAARAEAAKLVDGRIEPLPAPGKTGREQSRAADAPTAVALARVAGVPDGCARSLQYGFAWAARMPAALPVYPRAEVQEAAGQAGEGCNVRAVVFTSPVPIGEVLGFYRTAAVKAGLGANFVSEGGDRVLEGRRGAARWTLFARERDDGLGEFELVTSGL